MPGDVVEVSFDMPVVSHIQSRHVAFARWPVLPAKDSCFADGDLSEPVRDRVADGNAMPSFTAVSTPSDGFRMAFSATLPICPHRENPEGAYPRTVFFCDYASADCIWRRDNYYRT